MTGHRTPKKSRPSDQGNDDDWNYLLNSEHHQFVSNLVPLDSPTTDSNSSSYQITVDSGALLFHQMPTVLFALHLVYEVSKLFKFCSTDYSAVMR